jgi:glycosyltransferase involved in cell wall biosynthesis
MKRRKILIAINCLNIGGAPTVVLGHLRGLNQETFELWVLTLYASKTANYEKEIEAIVGREHFIPFKLRGRSPLDLSTVWAIYQFLRHERFDVVVTHLFLANLIVRTAAALAHVPRIISFEHSRYTNKRLWQRVVDAWLARFTYRIVVATVEIAAYTARQEHIPKERFAVIPNPISLPPRDEVVVQTLSREWNIPEGKTVFLSLGRFSEEKGHAHLIRAATVAHAERPDIHVVIVGHGAREKELRALVTRVGAESYCTIITDPERARYGYYLADVFILPSLREGESIVVREAMSAGLPIIASDLPTLRPLVENEGILVPVGDEDALALAVVRLADDASLRARMSAIALRRAETFMADPTERFAEFLV